MSEDLTLFGMKVQVSESLRKDEFWLANERAANAIKDHDEGKISKNDRDAILGEELFYNRAALGRMS